MHAARTRGRRALQIRPSPSPAHPSAQSHCPTTRGRDFGPSVPPDRPWAESGARPVFVFVGPGISLTSAYHMFRAAELLFCNSSGYQALAPVMYDHQEGCAPGARVPAARQRAGGWQHQGGQTGRWAGARRPRVVMHALGFACVHACCGARRRAAGCDAWHALRFACLPACLPPDFCSPEWVHVRARAPRPPRAAPRRAARASSISRGGS